MSASRHYPPFLFFSGLSAIALNLFAVACDDKKPAADSPHTDAGATTDKYATADSKLTKALQAAAKGNAGSDDGPPPNGVFAPENADRRHPARTPAKVEVLNDGDEPRLAFTLAPDASVESALAHCYGPAVLEISLQLGPRATLPTIDMSWMIGPAKGDPGGPEWVLASLRKALPSREQADEIGADGAREIASLEGTQILLKLTADGRESDVQAVLDKGAQQELERVAKSAAEALVFATVPAPPKPVGVGAQWIAETRMPWSGIDVIAYRAFRVKSIVGDRLTLAVDVKGYAASGDIQLPGIPPGAVLKQFEAEAQGEMEAVRGEALARKFDMQERVVFVFSGGALPEGQSPGDQPSRPEGNTLTGQIQAAATFVRGEDLREAAQQRQQGKPSRK